MTLTMRSHLLKDAPVAMLFAIFESAMTLKKWFSHSNGSDFTAARAEVGRGWACTKPLLSAHPAQILANRPTRPRKKLKSLSNSESRVSLPAEGRQGIH